MKRSEMADPLSVAEACAGISEALIQQFGSEVWIRGAITGLQRRGNHVYFSLVDPAEIGRQPTAVISVALFANVKYRVNQILKRTSGAIRMVDGVEVSIAGALEHYAPSGRVQLIMATIDPSYTLGKLAANREATLQRLSSEGLLERNKALHLPVLPHRIALVTSGGSAAEADFVEELRASGLLFNVTLLDARVQGAESIPTLVRAIGAATADRFDLVVVVRGGGAKTDLVSFDDYEVAAAIARCPVPVVVGIGHETDRSIADEIAAVSTKTPTAAAGWIVGLVASFDRRVATASERLVRACEQRLQKAGTELEAAHRRLVTGATTALGGAEHRQERAALRLAAAGRASLAAATHRLERNRLRVAALDPVAVMARGWSITRAQDGTVLRRATHLQVGETIHTQLADGTLTSTITTVDIQPAADPANAPTNEETNPNE